MRTDAKAAGIDVRVKLRHGCATHLLQDDADLRDVQAPRPHQRPLTSRLAVAEMAALTRAFNSFGV